VMDVDGSQRLLDPLEHLLLGKRLEGRPVSVFERVAVRLDQRLGEVDQVLPAVEVLVVDRRQRQTELLQVAVLQAAAERHHLVAGVVEVVLALYVVASGFQQARHRVPDHSAAAAADRQRPSGIGADELDLGALAPAKRNLTDLLALTEDDLDQLGEIRLRQREVDEAWPGNLHPADEVSGGQVLHERFGHVARLHLGQLGEAERDGAVVVSLVGASRGLNGDLRQLECGQGASLLSADDCSAEQLTVRFWQMFHAGSFL